MSTFRNYLLSIGITLLLTLVFALFLTILNYFDVLSNGIYKGFLILLSIISVIVGSFLLGNKSNNKGYLRGVLFGIIVSFIYIVFSFFFKNDINVTSFLYYVIIIITSLIGGALGINKKTTES